MNDDQCQDHSAGGETTLTPNLDVAIRKWQEGTARFKADPARPYRDLYCKLSDELGQAISSWRYEQPELFEQFALWFAANPRALTDSTARQPEPETAFSP